MEEENKRIEEKKAEVKKEIKKEKGEKVEKLEATEIKKEEAKTEETKKEEKVEEKKDGKKKEDKPKKTDACVNGKDIQISTKHAVAVCNFIRGRRIEDAINGLGEVAAGRKAIRFKGEIPHRKGEGMMSGRYPKNASNAFIKLLKSLLANSIVNGIEDASVIEAVANKAARPLRRHGQYRFKRTHVYLKAGKKSKGKK